MRRGKKGNEKTWTHKRKEERGKAKTTRKHEHTKEKKKEEKQIGHWFAFHK